MENLVVVNIPIYKSEVEGDELVSLLNCIKVLKNYPIVFLAPKSLNIQFYQYTCSGTIDFKVETFDDRYFANINGYNKLMLKLEFYKKFKHYQFLLIFQLDAWVFKDELAYWCKQGYDYIGAPWYESWHKADNTSKFIGVGNGGFSLRKVSNHLKVLRSFSYLIPPKKIIKEALIIDGYTLKSLIKIINNLTFKNNTFYLFNNFDKNEDYFWGVICSAKFNWFKIPSEQVASQFSMEVLAPKLYHQNNNQLPFGCHGWFKYEVEFWKKHIRYSK